MQTVLDDFLFGHLAPTSQPCGRTVDWDPPETAGYPLGVQPSNNFPQFQSHVQSAFLFSGAPAAVAPGAAAQGMGSNMMGKLSSMKGALAAKAGFSKANGYNQFPDPQAVGINPATEITRINTNIMIYNALIGASAIGIGVSMCLFVRSILKPPKGYHGGDSDEDMDSDEEDDDSDES